MWDCVSRVLGFNSWNGIILSEIQLLFNWLSHRLIVWSNIPLWCNANIIFIWRIKRLVYILFLWNENEAYKLFEYVCYCSFFGSGKRKYNYRIVMELNAKGSWVSYCLWSLICFDIIVIMELRWCIFLSENMRTRTTTRDANALKFLAIPLTENWTRCLDRFPMVTYTETDWYRIAGNQKFISFTMPF